LTPDKRNCFTTQTEPAMKLVELILDPSAMRLLGPD